MGSTVSCIPRGRGRVDPVISVLDIRASASHSRGIPSVASTSGHSAVSQKKIIRKPSVDNQVSAGDSGVSRSLKDQFNVTLSATAVVLLPSQRKRVLAAFKSLGIKLTAHMFVMMSLMARPIKSKYQNELFELEKPRVDWGYLHIQRQVPTLLPAKIDTPVYQFFVMLGRYSSLDGTVSLHGTMGGDPVCLTAPVSMKSKRGLGELEITDLLLNALYSEDPLEHPGDKISSRSSVWDNIGSLNDFESDDEQGRGHQAIPKGQRESFSSTDTGYTSAGSSARKNPTRKTPRANMAGHKASIVPEEDDNVLIGVHPKQKGRRKDTPAVGGALYDPGRKTEHKVTNKVSSKNVGVSVIIEEPRIGSSQEYETLRSAYGKLSASPTSPCTSDLDVDLVAFSDVDSIHGGFTSRLPCRARRLTPVHKKNSIQSTWSEVSTSPLAHDRDSTTTLPDIPLSPSPMSTMRACDDKMEQLGKSLSKILENKGLSCSSKTSKDVSKSSQESSPSPVFGKSFDELRNNFKFFSKEGHGSPRPSIAGRKVRSFSSPEEDRGSEKLACSSQRQKAWSLSSVDGPEEHDDRTTYEERRRRPKGMFRRDTPKACDAAKLDRGFLKQLRNNTGRVEEEEETEPDAKHPDADVNKAESSMSQLQNSNCNSASDHMATGSNHMASGSNHMAEATDPAETDSEQKACGKETKDSTEVIKDSCLSKKDDSAKSSKNNRVTLEEPVSYFGAKPKVNKVLKRKNTPAKLPRMQRAYVRNSIPQENTLEEDEEEEEEKEEGEDTSPNQSEDNKMLEAAGGEEVTSN